MRLCEGKLNELYLEKIIKKPTSTPAFFLYECF